MNLTYMHAHTFIDQNGRILIPAPMRKELKLHTGDRMAIRIIDGELRLLSLDKVINETQALFKKLTKPNISDVDEFIAERKKEAILEDSEFSENNL